MLLKRFILKFFGTSDYIDRTGAQALMPEDVSKEIIDGVAESSVIMQVATRAPNMSRAQRRIPVLSTLPTAYFIAGDTGLKQTTKTAWANKYFNAEEIAVIVPIPEAVLDDADYDIWAQIQPRIIEAIGIAFDAAVMFGTNAPASWPDDLLAGATAAGNVVAFGTNPDLYDDLLSENGVISAVEEDGFMATGHISALSMRAKYRGLRDSDGNPIFKTSMQDDTKYNLDGAPLFFPRNGAFDPSQALQMSGDFKQVVYTIRQDLTYKMLTEAVIQDSEGAIVYNLAQQDMVALRVVIRVAWQLPNPINRIQATEADRYPIGILTPAV